MAAVRIFRLAGVPDDEIEDIRRILDGHQIAHYETPTGIWGLAGGAIWVNDAGQAGHARVLIENYQRDRAAKMRQAYAQRKSRDEIETIVDRLRQGPARFIVYAAAAAGVLYLSIKPFLYFGK